MRAKAFKQGLARLGYEVRQGITGSPGDSDLLVTWNRIGTADELANRYSRVIVAENAAWGNDFLGQRWYSLANDLHNTRDRVPYRGQERWDRLGMELAPFRTEGETVILPQRGIGTRPVVMPRSWPQTAYAKHGGRIRQHPGRNACKPLENDLAKAGRVITWGSGAAIKALIWGIPVTADYQDWIGQQDNTELGRTEMFRRLAWAQWRLEEIASGEAFACVLSA